MGEDKPQTNGNDLVQNGVNGTSEDIEMDDESTSPVTGAKGKDKDGDEEMTVVVPPSKTPKLGTDKGQDGDMDVDVVKDADTPEEVKVDPVAKAVSGLYTAPCNCYTPVEEGRHTNIYEYRYQRQLRTSRACCDSVRPPIYASGPSFNIVGP